MANMNGADTSDAKELGNFSPMPQGEYQAIVESSERKPTKANDGEYLATTWVIYGGEYDGRKVFHNFNLWNKSQQAVDIAKSEWKAVCEATVGRPSVQDSAETHNRRVVITLKIGKDGNGNPRNDIVFQKDKIRSLNTPAPASNAPAPAAANAGTGGKRAPW